MIPSRIKYLGYAEISNFNVQILINKNILRFDISVQDLFAVDKLDCEDQLEQPGDYQVLVEMLLLRFY
jgi:hypothetical protein